AEAEQGDPAAAGAQHRAGRGEARAGGGDVQGAGRAGARADAPGAAARRGEAGDRARPARRGRARAPGPGAATARRDDRAPPAALDAAPGPARAQDPRPPAKEPARTGQRAERLGLSGEDSRDEARGPRPAGFSFALTVQDFGAATSAAWNPHAR